MILEHRTRLRSSPGWCAAGLVVTIACLLALHSAQNGSSREAARVRAEWDEYRAWMAQRASAALADDAAADDMIPRGSGDDALPVGLAGSGSPTDGCQARSLGNPVRHFPRIIHQTWFGDMSRAPHAFMNGCRAMNPGEW